MLQIARDLTDSQAGALHAKRYVIIDRDTKYSAQFRRLIRHNGINVIRLPPMSPNLNAYAERFVRSIKDECLNRMIFVGQAPLRRAVTEYVEHYHRERNHQGLENRLIQLPTTATGCYGPIRCHARLGGTLNFYYCEAGDCVVPIFGQHGVEGAAVSLVPTRNNVDSCALNTRSRQDIHRRTRRSLLWPLDALGAGQKALLA